MSKIDGWGGREKEWELELRRVIDMNRQSRRHKDRQTKEEREID